MYMYVCMCMHDQILFHMIKICETLYTVGSKKNPKKTTNPMEPGYLDMSLESWHKFRPKPGGNIYPLVMTVT